MNRCRAGVAAAELAICLPMLMALTFGAIEATNAIFVKKALVEAAYEAGNVASSIGGTSSVAISRAQGVSKLLGVNAVTVKVSPTVTTNTATGTPITVTCTTSLASNSVTGWCIGNVTYTATYTVIHL
ncbi:TadE/TadG family type IV pilus assembly protein [Schlesneria paludicola]|uniref:TadE/TadG family type IV pilus assembly protein n=1 Tax=Schlesneria paludicola TaxID=360056 RepID=UPI001ED92F07|nr:TadE/TadG family type IV pilus assembly protein [Schlesneria paludicola]